MNLIIDIEANGLVNPDKIWLIICKDVDTGEYYYFRNVTENKHESERFSRLCADVVRSGGSYIGHNYLGYDRPVLVSTLKLHPEVLPALCTDTLIISKLVDYSRPGGHSVEQYGVEFGYEKGYFTKFTDPTLDDPNSPLFKELEKYCKRDVDITHKVYLKYLRVIKDKQWEPSITLEHQFQYIVNSLSTNGFSFNKVKALGLLNKVVSELSILDEALHREFPPKTKLIKEYTPKETKYGTISRTSVPRSTDRDLSAYTAGATFSTFSWVEFNPSSHKQVIQVLNEAGWKPTDKTTTHIEAERELNQLKYQKNRSKELDLRIAELYNKLQSLAISGWKINETNLATLPSSAPSPARSLAKRILLEARRRTLTEWLDLVGPDDRIHGKYYGIGAWTHRMAHQAPNTANIPTDAKLYGNEMRALWRAPRNRLLVGVDAEGIQLRIFAHYINDKEFTEALVKGKKDDKTDPHSLNKRILGDACQSRQTAKRFIYALLLGAGIGKLSEILGVGKSETEEALDRLLQRYTGFKYLKENIIPADAKSGWFLGLDGRRVPLPGSTVGTRKHLCMSGYLQNGEAIVMKKACLKWHDRLKEDGALLVNFVHDEWQTEVPNNMQTAIRIAKMQADSLREVGEELKLNCPLAGSYWSDDHNDYTIGTNWSVTH